MWRSASASDPARRPPQGAFHLWPALPLLCLWGAWLVVMMALPAALARELVSLEEALERAVPQAATREKDTLFLDADQTARIFREAGSKPPSRLATRYRLLSEEGTLLATAYLDTHLVRSLAETLLIVVGPEGRVLSVIVLSFAEPPEYQPKERWYAQFRDRPLDDDLRLRRGLRVLAGATLSSRAATAAVRRALVLHRLLPPHGSPR